MNDNTYRGLTNYVKHMRPNADVQQPAAKDKLFVTRFGGPIKPSESFPRHWFTIFKETRKFNPTTMQKLQVSVNPGEGGGLKY